ncbi:MAG: helix-turn-helix transcriptional regulator [Sulfurimonas sp.]|nr:helix-turn-helix transcriptional regulator [Sulfurimonas sp.]
METKPSFKNFKSKALSDENVKKEYDLLEERYKIIDILISMRKASGLTQEEIAAALHTNKSNISRLESHSYSSSPKLSTLVEYAHATGHKLEVNFERF